MGTNFIVSIFFVLCSSSIFQLGTYPFIYIFLPFQYFQYLENEQEIIQFKENGGDDTNQ